MEQLQCTVERITYHNEENGYTVLRCRAQGFSDPVTVVGHMTAPHAGAGLQVTGEWKTDARYGRQFAAAQTEEVMPATVRGMEKYLGSGMIKGIGPKLAGRIVRKFGKDTLDIIEQHPERLLEVEGLGQGRVEKIKQSWEEQREIKNIMLFLQSYEVSTAHAARIFKMYGSESVQVVKNNPYRLADDIRGIGFKTADQIAARMGMEKDCSMRLRSGLLYTMNQLADSGHCYAGREQLLEQADALLEAGEPKLTQALEQMRIAGDLIFENETIWLPAFHLAETGCARILLQLCAAEGVLRRSPDEILQRMQQQTKLQYDAVQLEAIRTALTEKVMVLTGGPGTGKTTTTLGILSACRAAGCSVLLAAPTGRAAKRLSEAAGMEARTIHRLLEYSPGGGWKRNAQNPLEGDVLILDECSMIDLMLFYGLLKAVPAHMRLILVGDVDQLPSVGAGNVLKDIIASGRVPVVRLTRIFRQAQGSRIVLNAHRINRGEAPDLRGGRDADFFFAARQSGEEIAQTIVDFCTRRLPAAYHLDPQTDIQVLTPMQRGECGAANLNSLLQEAMNAGRPGLRRGDTQYRLRDKVMQIRNDYEKEVFNGDIGTVVRVDPEERQLTVRFDGRDVGYDSTELDSLTLAWAVTIHKSQGSEYPVVVIPMTMSHYVMLQRNLLYTGVTRAKKILVLVGEKKAIYCAIRNAKTAERNTKLAERLQGKLPLVSVQQQLVVPVQPAAPAAAPDPAGQAGDYAAVLQRLARSDFRSRFRLDAQSLAYIQEKGTDTIRRHAADFIAARLAPAEPENDGRQTPMRGHPVFIAQHATATCCRGCLEKWHHIPHGTALTAAQQAWIVGLIMAWICRQAGLAQA